MIKDEADFGIGVCQNMACELANRSSVLVLLDIGKFVGIGGIRVFDKYRDAEDFYLAKDNLTSGSIEKFEFVSDDINSIDDLSYVISLGVKNFVEPDLYSKLSCDTGILMFQVAMKHEYRHLLQYEVTCGRLSESDDISNEVIASLIMSRHNQQFYLGNYKLMPHELDAERFGVLTVYRNGLASGMFRDIDSTMNDAFKRFNDLGVGPFYFDTRFRDFDVFRFSKAIDTQLDKSLYSRRNISSITSSLSITNTDFVNSYFDKNPDELRFFKSLKRGSDQDAYFAMVVMQHHPEDKHFFDINSLVYPDGLRVPSGESPMRNVIVAKPDMLFDSLADDISLHRKQISDAFDYEFG